MKWILSALLALSASKASSTMLTLHESAQAHLFKAASLLDFYSQFFTELNRHGDNISGEDHEKIKSRINVELKWASENPAYAQFIDRNIFPYFNDMPKDELRLLDTKRFLMQTAQDLNYLSEVLKGQIENFKREGKFALSDRFAEQLKTQSISESLYHLLHQRSEINTSTFIKNQNQIKPYLIRLVITSTNSPFNEHTNKMAALGQSQNTAQLEQFRRLLSQIEFSAGQKLRMISSQVRSNASL